MRESVTAPALSRFDEWNVNQSVVWTIVAMFGGMAKYLHQMQQSGKPFKFAQLLAKAFVSGFSGVTAGHTAVLMSDDVNFVFVLVALGGWLGAEMLDVIWTIIQKRFLK